MITSTGIPFRFGVNDEGEYGYILRDEDGADTVYPFKSVSKLTEATATAGDITVGKSAWVNGELIIGTRPAPINSQTGSFYYNAPGKNALGVHGDYAAVSYYYLKFPNAFDSVPKVTTTYSGSERVVCRGASSITKVGCTITIASDRGGTYGITIYWTATC